MAYGSSVVEQAYLSFTNDWSKQKCTWVSTAVQLELRDNPPAINTTASGHELQKLEEGAVQEMDKRMRTKYAHYKNEDKKEMTNVVKGWFCERFSVFSISDNF